MRSREVAAACRLVLRRRRSSGLLGLGKVILSSDPPSFSSPVSLSALSSFSAHAHSWLAVSSLRPGTRRQCPVNSQIHFLFHSCSSPLLLISEGRRGPRDERNMMAETGTHDQRSSVERIATCSFSRASGFLLLSSTLPARAYQERPRHGWRRNEQARETTRWNGMECVCVCY